MLELRVDLQARINAFERYIKAQFIEIDILDLGHIREEADKLRIEVCSQREPYNSHSSNHNPSGSDITSKRA